MKSLIVGPVLEIHVPRHLSVELDGLYRPLWEHNKTLLDNGTVYSSVIYTETATWEFPVLAKYRFRLGRVNPFAQAGPSFRLPVRSLSADGMTAGAGVEMHWHALHIAPTFRFTRWGASNAIALSEPARNEVALLVGFFLGGPTPAAR